MDGIRNRLNEIYCPLYMKSAEILSRFCRRTFEAELNWYCGHYSKDGGGQYTMDYFPIPVISVKGLCDIETGLDRISVSAKLKREKALSYPYEDFEGIPFEVYGVEDYLSDYYNSDMTLEQLRENIAKSGEKEIGFAFDFDRDENKDRLFDFAKLLRRKGFYY